MPRIEFATVVDAAGETAISTDFEENVLFTTAERMKKPFAAIGFAGAIALLVAGCTAGTEPAPVSAPAPVVAAPVVAACSTEDLGPWGDVVAYKDVTDEFGTYCQTTIDPDAAALKYDVSKVDLESLKEYGFTEQDVKDRLVEAAEFFSQEVLDSTVLDNTTEETFTIWSDKNKDAFSGFVPSYGTLSQEIVYNKVLPVLIRDGSPRSSETLISFVKAYGIEGTDGSSVLIINYQATANYRVADEEAISFTLERGEFTGTREELIEQRSYLTNGKPNNIRLDANYFVGFSKGGQLVGTSYKYDTVNIALDFE